MKLDVQSKTIEVMNIRAQTTRWNTCVATLTSRTETAMMSVKNCFDMAMAMESTPNPSHPMWKMCYDAIKEHNDLKKKLEEVDIEEVANNENVKNSSAETQNQSEQNEEEKTDQNANEQTQSCVSHNFLFSCNLNFVSCF